MFPKNEHLKLDTRNNKRHSYANKKSWRFFSHIYKNRLGGESLAMSLLKSFAPAIQLFLCIGTLYDDTFLGWVGIAQYWSLDGFYSASVSFLNFLGL